MKRVITAIFTLLLVTVLFTGCPTSVGGSYIGTWTGTVPSKTFGGDATIELTLNSGDFSGTLSAPGGSFKYKGTLKEENNLLIGTITHSDYGSGWEAVSAEYSYWYTYHYSYVVEGSQMKITGSHIFIGIPFGTYTFTKK